MTKITIDHICTEQREVEVTFPFYTLADNDYDNGGTYERVERVEETGRVLSLKKTTDGRGGCAFECEIETCKSISRDYGDVLNRRSPYVRLCTETHFFDLLEEMREILAKFPDTVETGDRDV